MRTKRRISLIVTLCMKMKDKNILFLIVTVILCIASKSWCVNAEMNDRLALYERISEIEEDVEYWINEDGSYSYPAEYDMLEIKHEPLLFQREAYTIPEFVLAEISTENLLRMVLDYPLLCDMYAYGSICTGFENLCNTYNGIQELLSRDDIYETALAFYKKITIPTDSQLKMSELRYGDESEIYKKILADKKLVNMVRQDAKVICSVDLLEIILNEEFKYMNKMQKKNFIQDIRNTLARRNASGLFAKDTSLFLNYIYYSIQEMSVSRLSDFNMASFGDDIMYTYYIDTPSGTHVLVEYNNTGNMISQDVAISLADQHNATIVSSANSDWNCHSFAWLQGLYSPSLYTHIWMNLYTPFAADSAYSHSTSPQVGAIVTYGAIHSALVSAVNIYNPMHYMPEPLFLSKWGGGYIYSHFPDNCPYTHQGFDYYMLTSS